MTARKFAWFTVVLSVLITVASFGIADALETKYYNKVPYHVLFQSNPNKIMVQGNTKSGKVVQAVVPVDQKEDMVEQQELKKEDKTKGD